MVATKGQSGRGQDEYFFDVIPGIWKKRNERQNVGGVSIRSRNGAPSRKGCAVVKRLRQATNEYPPPPLHNTCRNLGSGHLHALSAPAPKPSKHPCDSRSSYMALVWLTQPLHCMSCPTMTSSMIWLSWSIRVTLRFFTQCEYMQTIPSTTFN